MPSDPHELRGDVRFTTLANPHSSSPFIADMRRLEAAQRNGKVRREQLYENDPAMREVKERRNAT